MTEYKTKKTGELSTKDGYEIAEYDNGAWRYTGDGGKTKGAIAIRPPEEEFTIEEDHPMNAALMSKRSDISKKQKFQDAITRMAHDHLDGKTAGRIENATDVYAEAAALLTMEIFEPDNPLRDRTHTLERVGAVAGVVDKYKDGKGGPTQAIQVNITISDKALAGIEASDEIIDALWEEE